MLTNATYLSSPKKEHPTVVNYTLHSRALKRVSSAKYLGVELIKDLHFQFQATLVKANKNVFISSVEIHQRLPHQYVTPTVTKVSSIQCSMLTSVGSPSTRSVKQF